MRLFLLAFAREERWRGLALKWALSPSLDAPGPGRADRPLAFDCHIWMIALTIASAILLTQVATKRIPLWIARLRANQTRADGFPRDRAIAGRAV